MNSKFKYLCRNILNFYHARINNLSWIFLTIIIIFLLLPGFFWIPNEDAAILYLYAKNLANQGIVAYNSLSGFPTEGATDFGFMIIISFLSKLGFNEHLSSIFISIFSIFPFYICASTLNFNKSQNRNLTIWFICSYFFIFIFSGAFISGSFGFSTTTSALLLSSIFILIFSGEKNVLLLVLSILYVLIRPDHIYYITSLFSSYFFSLLILKLFKIKFVSRSFLGSIDSNSIKKTIIPKIFILLLTVSLFSIYWIARWSYFGDFFPLPYYVKAKVEYQNLIYLFLGVKNKFIFGYSRKALGYIFISLVFIFANFIFENKFSKVSFKKILNFKNNKSKELLINFTNNYNGELRLIITVFIFGISQAIYLSRFVLMQNTGDRFGVPFFSLSLIVFLFTIFKNFQYLNFVGNPIKKIILFLFALSTLIPIKSFPSYFWRANNESYKAGFTFWKKHSFYQLAIDFNKNFSADEKKNTLILTSNAGIFPYYSGLNSIDAWGLNDKRFSKEPLQDPLYVKKINPDLIATFADYQRLTFKDLPVRKLRVGRNCALADIHSYNYCGWHEMNQALFQGAVNLGYKIYIVPGFRKGNPYKTTNKNYNSLLYMLNPESNTFLKSKIIIEKFGSIEVKSENELKKFKNKMSGNHKNANRLLEN